MPFSANIKIQQVQQKQMAVMSFLAGLPPEFKTAKSHILSNFEISSLHDIFTRVFHRESSSPIPSPTTSALFVAMTVAKE